MDSVFTSPTPENSYVQILAHSVTVLGGRAFGRWLGYEGGALTEGISVLVKGAPVGSLAPATL